MDVNKKESNKSIYFGTEGAILVDDYKYHTIMSHCCYNRCANKEKNWVGSVQIRDRGVQEG